MRILLTGWLLPLLDAFSHVVQILGNASQHRFGGLCLLIRGLMQSEESFKSGIQKKTIRVCTVYRNALV